VKPYYEQDGITIYHGDCREILPRLRADALVFDPPYGISLRNGDVDGHRSERWGSIVGDEDGEVGRFAIAWALGGGMTVAAFASPWKPWPGRWRNQIVWDKGGAVGGGGDIRTCLKRSWELIQVWNRGPINGGRGESVWRYPIVPQDTSDHIAAKPVALMARLIHTFTDVTDSIVDPTMGSGSTLAAARLCGRRAVGVEVEERYCEIAARRLEEARAQQSLPLEASA
jgi:hypothetical protein